MPTVTFVFTGRFEPASFAEFARHRVARLSLDARRLMLRPDRVRITVSGQDDLVDAFEMACSLGPIDCLVDDVVRYRGDHRQSGTSDRAAGLARRSRSRAGLRPAPRRARTSSAKKSSCGATPPAQPHVWEDRCPHRGMRLSYGYVRADRIACLYHGWQYGTDGHCLRIPAHPEIKPPPSIMVWRHSCREALGLIFAHFGEADDRAGCSRRSRRARVHAGSQHPCRSPGRGLGRPVCGAGNPAVPSSPEEAQRFALRAEGPLLVGIDQRGQC